MVALVVIKAINRSACAYYSSQCGFCEKDDYLLFAVVF